MILFPLRIFPPFQINAHKVFLLLPLKPHILTTKFLFVLRLGVKSFTHLHSYTLENILTQPTVIPSGPGAFPLFIHCTASNNSSTFKLFTKFNLASSVDWGNSSSSRKWFCSSEVSKHLEQYKFS